MAWWNRKKAEHDGNAGPDPVQPVPVEPDEVAEELSARLRRVHELIRELNGHMAELPKNYGLWMDWQHKPRPKLLLTEGYRIERQVVEPPD